MFTQFLRWFGLAHHGRLSWAHAWTQAIILVFGLLLLLIALLMIPLHLF